MGEWQAAPSIVFNPNVGEDAYFPGPAFWQSSARSADAPRGIQTSGITQPPIHARAALEMHRRAKDVDGSREFLRWLYPRLAAQHRYFADERDPTGIGLTAFVHPWESGLDNSPAWDRDLAAMVIPDGAVPPYVRHDLAHGDPKDRPSNEAYDRFVFLAARYRDSGYDDRAYPESTPFAVAGPLFNSIFLWSEHALEEIARIAGADPAPHRDAAATNPRRHRAPSLGSGDEAVLCARRRARRALGGSHDRVVHAPARSRAAEGTARSHRRRPALGELPS